MNSINPYVESFLAEVNQVTTRNELMLLKSKYLGKKSVITTELSRLASLDPSERARKGRELNEAKRQIEDKIAYLQKNIEIKKELEPIDVSRPGVPL